MGLCISHGLCHAAITNNSKFQRLKTSSLFLAHATRPLRVFKGLCLALLLRIRGERVATIWNIAGWRAGGPEGLSVVRKCSRPAAAWQSCSQLIGRNTWTTQLQGEPMQKTPTTSTLWYVGLILQKCFKYTSYVKTPIQFPGRFASLERWLMALGHHQSPRVITGTAWNLLPWLSLWGTETQHLGLAWQCLPGSCPQPLQRSAALALFNSAPWDFFRDLWLGQLLPILP